MTFDLDIEALASIFEAYRHVPVVDAQRRHWSNLLSTALGTLFVDSDDLFVRHSLLVCSAKIIAHAAFGFDVRQLSAREILSGAQFERARLHGAVESDVFDWIAEVGDADAFFHSLIRQLSAFDWSSVDRDVLEALYQSVMTADTRKRLGEHYTPNWLAYKVVEQLLPDPLDSRVLDPSCGSGVFLFHAVRRYLQAAEERAWPMQETLHRLMHNVLGIDLHPVAVVLARVTYLLAIGRSRINCTNRGPLRIPVFLGDSMQWRHQRTFELDRVDVLIGNPPWLAYRHMPADMQSAFQKMSVARGLWHGAKVATHQDLSALFVARAVELYLKKNGRFGFVMPSAVIDTERKHYQGFRTGQLSHEHQQLFVAFEQPWDLKRLRPHFFPITASVIFGSRQDAPVPMLQGETWTGRLPEPHGTWSDVESAISRQTQVKTDFSGQTSPYAERFRQGATIVPRVLFMVERRESRGKTAVRSLRSANEKPPWKSLPDREGVVESIFVRPVHTGESILPYRTRPPLNAVIPRDRNGLMAGTTKRLDQYPELAKWWRSAEATWMQYRSSDRLSLAQQLNYHKKLESQFPMPPIRVLYGRSGMHLAAAYIQDTRAIIDNSLYWAAAESVDEALYLCAIMNAAMTTQLVRPLMSFGKDERDIHKSIWKLPIPYFDEQNANHLRLVELAKDLEARIDALDIPENLHFAAARRRIRQTIEANAAGKKIEQLVSKLLSV